MSVTLAEPGDQPCHQDDSNPLGYSADSEHVLDPRTHGEQDRQGLELPEPKPEKETQAIHVSTRSFQIATSKRGDVPERTSAGRRHSGL